MENCLLGLWFGGAMNTFILTFVLGICEDNGFHQIFFIIFWPISWPIYGIYKTIKWIYNIIHKNNNNENGGKGQRILHG